jgi:2-polyprenyl-3-methyl-5-hydroxy-6-metoxy-1,4-benzoquinol methylase
MVEKTLRQRMKSIMKERLKKRYWRLPDRILVNFVPAYWRLAALRPLGSRILDIGCGGGWKLNLYKEFGWKTYGFDISSEAIGIAKSKGHDVVVAEIENVSYPDKYFDAIQISHVIEHLPNPVFTIKKAFSLLKEEGLLLLETPNNSSLLSKVFKPDFWQIDSPRHFQIFNIKSLTFLLVDCGFIIDKLITNNSKNGIINSVQAFVTRKYGNRKNIKNNKIMQLISNFLLYVISPLNKFGLGENIIVFAKKRDKKQNYKL